MIKRHTRPNPAKQIKGGIAERESADRGFERDDRVPGMRKAVRIAHHVDQRGRRQDAPYARLPQVRQTLDKK